MARRLVLIVPDGADSLLAMLDGYMRETAVSVLRNIAVTTLGCADTEPPLTCGNSSCSACL